MGAVQSILRFLNWSVFVIGCSLLYLWATANNTSFAGESYFSAFISKAFLASVAMMPFLVLFGFFTWMLKDLAVFLNFWLLIPIIGVGLGNSNVGLYSMHNEKKAYAFLQQNPEIVSDWLRGNIGATCIESVGGGRSVQDKMNFIRKCVSDDWQTSNSNGNANAAAAMDDFVHWFGVNEFPKDGMPPLPPLKWSLGRTSEYWYKNKREWNKR